jgi:bifunctional DNA primase/polymerase-like protein/AAA domain-containing protein
VNVSTIEMVDAALQYAEHGDPVFPVWWAKNGRCACPATECESAAKHPIASCAPNGLKDATTDAETIRRWWSRFPHANIATRTGIRRTVLDVDVKAGGHESLARLEAQHGELPTTATVLTGGGGEHRHLASVPGLRNSAGKIAPGLDIRGEDGYVLLPPSNHVSGGTYLDDLLTPMYETPLARMPTWLVTLAQTAPTDNGHGPNRSTDEWADRLTGAPLGQRRAVALEIAGHFLGLLGPDREAEVLGILLGYAARCEPPFPEREARALVRDLARRDRARSSSGSAPTDESSPHQVIEVVDAADLVARTFPDEPPLVGGGLMVPRALAVTAGPPKRGKSLYVLNREIRRALAQPFLGFTTTPGRTLYFNAEIPEPQLKDRFVLMLRGAGFDGRPVDAEAVRGRIKTVTQRGLFLDEPAGYDAVRRLIEAAQPDLVTLDPLARFFSGEENSARDMGRLVASLDRLIQEYRVAVELVHHTGKPQAGDPRQGGHRLRGSSALFGAADAVVLLDRTAEAWRLSFELRHAEEPAPMTLTRSASLWYSASGPPEKFVAVAELVSAFGLKWAALVGAIKEQLKTSESTAERMVRETKKAGLIWQDDSGIYRQTVTNRQRSSDGGVSTGSIEPF